jgi:hypothetical protein
MKYEFVTATLKEMRRKALDTGKIHIVRLPDGANLAVYQNGNDWHYEINGVSFKLSQFEQAMTLLSLNDMPMPWCEPCGSYHHATAEHIKK